MRNIWSKCAFIFFALLAFFVGSSGEIAMAVSASSLAFQSSGSVHDTDGWVLYRNGYLGTFIDVPTEQTVSAVIRAEGSIGSGTLPIMELHIGDSSKSWSVADYGGSHNTYSYLVAEFVLPEGMHTVRIEYINDFSDPNRNLYIKSINFSGASLENSASSSNALGAADNYIDKYRQGTAKVTVTIDDVNIPQGTPVEIKLHNHEFNFGAAVYGHSEVPSWTAPNPAPGSDNYKYQQFLDSHFNMLVPENSGKWGNNESTRDVVTMDAVDAMLDYAEAHGLRARMHCTFWNYQVPDWVTTLLNDAITDPNAADELRDEMTERIDYYIADRAHRLVDIDGINEDLWREVYLDLYGVDGLADIYNEMVAAAAGQAKIGVNEYAIVDGLGPYGEPYFRSEYLWYVDDIIGAGGTVECVGIQSHTSVDRYGVVNVFENLQLMAGLEVPIIISEFSIDEDESSHTEILTESMRLTFGNDMATTFIMWGFWGKDDWIWRSGSALVNENWNLTAMGVAYEQLMSQWDTHEVVYVDANSQIEFSGFYGDYNLTVEGRTYSFTFYKGEEPSEPVFSVLYVDDDAPGDPAAGDPDTSDPNEDGSIDHPFDAIQEAIDAAAYRETIIVRDGTYTGEGNRDIYFDGKAIIVKSEKGPKGCIIDCQAGIYDNHSGFHFADQEDANSILEGLTITGGLTTSQYGGAVGCYNVSSPRINDCILINNTSLSPGGAIYIGPGSEPVVTNCIIVGNVSAFGGAIFCDNSSVTLRNCILADNFTDSWGGAICSDTGSLTLQNCTFSNNTAEYGGGLCLYDSAATLDNCILWADTASPGPELVVAGSASDVTVSYSDVQGGESAVDVEAGSTLIWDPNNIDLDPNFVDADHPDPNERDYHLLPESPCINAGDPAGGYSDQTDIDDQPRILFGRIDMGADEFVYVGDLDYDGKVDLFDFASLGKYWQETECYGRAECVEADLNRDTDVDLKDLQCFVQNWLKEIL